MPKTVFFAICVDSEADAAIVAALTNVDGVEDDPPRTLSVVEGSFVKRRLQAFQQVTPYGIEMVNAPGFWSRYNGNQGSGIKVCVIDTGLLLSHEDIRDGDVSGSDGAGLLSPVSYGLKT
jgi:subtilisin family serine protease